VITDKYKFGLIEPVEAEGIYKTLFEMKFPYIKVVEIGLWDFFTANAICEILADIGCKKFRLFGIDNIEHRALVFPNNGVSAIYLDANNPEVFQSLPKEFHFVLVDGCHCKHCVMNQFRLYAPRVAKGGVIAFHDTSQESQGDIVSVGCENATIEVLAGLEELQLNDNGFALIRECNTDKRHGIRFYKKL